MAPRPITTKLSLAELPNLESTHDFRSQKWWACSGPYYEILGKFHSYSLCLYFSFINWGDNHAFVTVLSGGWNEAILHTLKTVADTQKVIRLCLLVLFPRRSGLTHPRHAECGMRGRSGYCNQWESLPEGVFLNTIYLYVKLFLTE